MYSKSTLLLWKPQGGNLVPLKKGYETSLPKLLDIRYHIIKPYPFLISCQSYYRDTHKTTTQPENHNNKLEDKKQNTVPTTRNPCMCMFALKNYPFRILSNRSTLFRALSNWWSMLFRDFSWQSTLLRDLSIWSKDILNFSSLSALFEWFFSFSGLSVLCLGFSLRSVLFLETSKISVLFRACSKWSVLLLELYLWEGDFSTVDMNFFRCLIYSG